MKFKIKANKFLLKLFYIMFFLSFISYGVRIGGLRITYIEPLFYFSITLILVNKNKLNDFFKFVYEYNFFLVMTFLVIFSQLKSSFVLSIPFKINDISEYIKFNYMFIIFLLIYPFRKKITFKSIEKILNYIGIFTLVISFLQSFNIFGFNNIIMKRILTNYKYRGLVNGNRIIGLFNNQNNFAFIVSILLLVFLSLYLNKNKKIHLVLFIGMAFALIFTKSRTGFVFGLVGVISNIFISRIKFSKKIIIFLISLLIFLLFFTFFGGNYLNIDSFDLDENSSFTTRVNNANKDINEFGISFLGIGPAKSIFYPFDTIGYATYLVRYGIIGLSWFIIMHLILIIKFMIKLIKNNNSNYNLNILYNINIVIPIMILIATITRDKWIDNTTLAIWFTFLAMSFIYEQKINYQKIED